MLTQVGVDRSLRQVLLQSVSAPDEIQWGLIGNAARSTGLSWALISYVGEVLSDLNLNYGLLAYVAKDTMLLMQTLESVGEDSNLAWSILTEAGDTLVLAYSSLSPVYGDMQASWEMVSLTESTMHLRWRLGAVSYPDVFQTAMVMVDRQKYTVHVVSG